MHLLATTSATLDEIEDALDLEQSPAECVVLSFSDSDLTALAHAWNGNRTVLPTLRLASLKKLRHPMSVDVYVESVIAHAKMVVVRCLGGLDYWRYGLEQIAAIARENGIVFAALPGDDRPDPRLTALSTATPEVCAKLDEYFRAGGSKNLNSALGFLANEAGYSTSWDDPKQIPALSVWPAPAKNGTRSGETKKPVALVVFYRANVLAADTAPIDALMATLAAEGLDPLAVSLTSLKDPAIAGELQHLITKHKPAIILNTTAFSALREDDTTVLDEAGVPVLQVVLSSATKEAWDASDRGLGPADLAMNVVLPELDGRILTRAISFKGEDERDPHLEHASVRNQPSEDRVVFVASLARNWVRLAATPARERRLALVLSDYPARAGRTGYAVGLDTTQSVNEIVALLTSAGYDTENGLRDGVVDALLREEAPDRISIPIAAYMRWFRALPSGARQLMEGAWGAPEDDPALIEDCFTFPCVRAGNVTILIQPDRGNTGDRKRSYHDTALPPRHAYVALYQWMQHDQRLHALIHLGTHGTLEWLPGKALALSADCFPEAVLGPVPVIYPFIVNNPGEAMQAKRRLAAVTLGHLTPPLREAGLSGALGDLEGLVDEYAQADGVDKRRMTLLEQEILDEARRSGLDKDCAIETDDTPREAIAKLDAQLCDIKELTIRDGLHVFGSPSHENHAKALSDAMVAAGGGGIDAIRVRKSIVQSATEERRALLEALDGKRIAAGPAGAPTRGRFDVLPTGRNLTSIDPRAIPTRTASKIGARAADEVVRRYLQDHGTYPRALVIDLWASASLRTGGDDLAQAFAYLGVRPVWDTASNRVTGIEVIPQAKLARPRIDVALRVSGLFRDIFATQIALFDTAVDRVASLDEDADWNPLVTTRGSGAPNHRVFSGAPGSFGAGAAQSALDTNWSDIDEIARAYMNASSFAVDRSGQSTKAERDLLACLSRADALIHPQDDRERDILDGDGVADFAGGFAAAATHLGNDVALYHLDTSTPDAPRARTMNEEIARIVRGRLTNPTWIAAMLEHGHRGVAEVAQSVDALYAFKATTQAVPDHLFDAVHDALIVDGSAAKKMSELNPHAFRAIAARLHDAISRGMWKARRNAVRDELENVLEERKLAQSSLSGERKSAEDAA